jgi:hypothetical protein
MSPAFLIVAWGLLAAGLLPTVGGEGALGDLSPRLRQLLETCELAAEENSLLHRQLRIELEKTISSAVTAIIKNISNSMVVAASDPEQLAGSEGIFQDLQTAVTRLAEVFPQACLPVAAKGGQGDELNTISALVVPVLSYMRSDMGGLFFIIQSWCFSSGCRRWSLLIPAMMLSPPVTLLWLSAVLTFKVLRACVAVSTWFASTALGAWLCRKNAVAPPAEDVEQGRNPDPAVSWFRRIIGSVVQLGGAPPTPSLPSESASPPAAKRTAAASTSTQDLQGVEEGGAAGLLHSSVASINRIFTM